MLSKIKFIKSNLFTIIICFSVFITDTINQGSKNINKYL